MGFTSLILKLNPPAGLMSSGRLETSSQVVRTSKPIVVVTNEPVGFTMTTPKHVIKVGKQISKIGKDDFATNTMRTRLSKEGEAEIARKMALVNNRQVVYLFMDINVHGCSL